MPLSHEHQIQEQGSQPSTDVRHVRISQSALVSAVGGKKLQGFQKIDYKGYQESNYEDHQEDSRHKQTRIDSFISNPDNNGDKKSNLRTEQSISLNTKPQTKSMVETQDVKGVTGIMNMRNTCYLNSTLQALRHNTEMSAFFLENKHETWINRKKSEPKVELVRGYADLLKTLWSGSKPAYVRPEGFLQAMMPAAKASGFDHFLVPEQHDSHEVLVFLLDQIHEGLAEEVNIQITRSPPQNSKDKAIQAALEAWKGFFGKQYSPLTEMIYGLLRVTMTCKGCNHSVDSWETFNCLKMPIGKDQPSTIEDMLKEELKEEEIEGYACDRCKPARTVAIRKPSIWRLPRMVCLVAKRFTYDGRKIHTPIQFPNYESISFSQFFSKDSPEPSQKHKYQCFATVDHYGSTGGGHYVAQAKSPLSDKWNLFNDESTQSISDPKFGENNYIFFLKPATKA
jgi:ubiquitin C-terminal hydrolase